MVFRDSSQPLHTTSGMTPKDKNTSSTTEGSASTIEVTKREKEVTRVLEITEDRKDKRETPFLVDGTTDAEGNMGQCMPPGCPAAPLLGESREEAAKVEISAPILLNDSNPPVVKPPAIPLQMTELPDFKAPIGESRHEEEEEAGEKVHDYDHSKLTQTLKHIRQCAEISRNTEVVNKESIDNRSNDAVSDAVSEVQLTRENQVACPGTSNVVSMAEQRSVHITGDVVHPSTYCDNRYVRQ